MDYQPYTLTTPKVTTKVLFSAEEVLLIRLLCYIQDSACLIAGCLEGALPSRNLDLSLISTGRISQPPIFTSNLIPTNFFFSSSFSSMFSFLAFDAYMMSGVQQKALPEYKSGELCLVPALASDQPVSSAKSLNIIILQFLIREMKS